MVRIRIPGGVAPDRPGPWRRPRSPPVTARTGCTSPPARTSSCTGCSDRDVPALLGQLGRVRPVDALGVRAHGAQRHGVRGRRRRPRRAVRLPPRRRGWSPTRSSPARPSSTCSLPSRLNIALGGSPRCRHDALVNDIGLVSMVDDGVRRLRGVGRRQPRQGAVAGRPAGAVRAPRRRAGRGRGASSTCSSPHGAFDEPAKGRLKFVVERHRRRRASAPRGGRRSPTAADAPAPGRRRRRAARRAPTAPTILAESPPGGWCAGVRPQRDAGPGVGDDRPPAGRHRPRRSWSCSATSPTATPTATSRSPATRTSRCATCRSPASAAIRARPRRARPVPARRGPPRPGPGLHRLAPCARSGSPTRPGAGRDLSPSAARCGATRRCACLVSGCPNSCAQHQIADIGLAGSKVRVGGRTVDGYQVYLGADLDQPPARRGRRPGRRRATSARPSTPSSARGRRCATTARPRRARPGGSASTPSPPRSPPPSHDRWAPGPEPADAVELTTSGDA